jgi:hypothetical protein
MARRTWRIVRGMARKLHRVFSMPKKKDKNGAWIPRSAEERRRHFIEIKGRV